MSTELDTACIQWAGGEEEFQCRHEVSIVFL
jgi:hypothetical protein